MLLLFAQVVILGHSVIPHHHHTDSSTQHHHHTDSSAQHHHHQDNEEPSEDNSLQLIFSSLIHSGEHLTFTQSENVKVVITKKAFLSLDALPGEFPIIPDYVVRHQKHTFPPNNQIIYQSPLDGSSSLRGPPAFIVA